MLQLSNLEPVCLKAEMSFQAEKDYRMAVSLSEEQD